MSINILHSLKAFLRVDNYSIDDDVKGGGAVGNIPRLCCKGSQPRKLKATQLGQASKVFTGQGISRPIIGRMRCATLIAAFWVLSDETYKHEVAAFISWRWHIIFHLLASRTFIVTQEIRKITTKINVALWALSHLALILPTF